MLTKIVTIYFQNIFIENEFKFDAIVKRKRSIKNLGNLSLNIIQDKEKKHTAQFWRLAIPT